tara:strand:+ start:13331 stop:14353 length:1023 start_codon:yes stop_codon:yes gene_type:complete
MNIEPLVNFIYKIRQRLFSRRVNTENYLSILDGWRGLSILLVLSAHLLPLGPSSLKLNSTAGPMGMSLFFSLSGFLIAHFFINNDNIKKFIIRRTFRIVPLSWLYLLIALTFIQAPSDVYLSHFLFYSNWPPMTLQSVTSHFWSLCVEMQFYLGIAVLYLFLGKKALPLAVILGFLVTINRINDGVYIAINTYYRIDEILAGVLLALIYHGNTDSVFRKILEKSQPMLILPFFIISCHPESLWFNYLRPYLAVWLIGSTLINPNIYIEKVLNNNILIYIAAISYALYVIHPILLHTWLGSGDKLFVYMKRPLLFIILFMLAHISTFYYEKFFINLAKRIN